MGMSPRLLRPRATSAYDSDAQVYFNAVALADGQQLEPAVKKAISDFVKGCKTDGIWSAIKASCLLIGARTLSGALTPLVGPAPTNVNFVSGDYDRKTGLLGNASTKYINSGRNNNAEGQNSKHVSLYASAFGSGADATFLGALPNTGAGRSNFEYVPATTNLSFHCNSVNTAVTRTGPTVGFVGTSRASSTAITTRMSGSTETGTVNSQTPYDGNLFVFCRNLNGSPNQYTNARIAFYSIGDSLTLATLDSRVSTLYTAIGASI